MAGLWTDLFGAPLFGDASPLKDDMRRTMAQNLGRPEKPAAAVICGDYLLHERSGERLVVVSVTKRARSGELPTLEVGAVPEKQFRG